MPAVTDPRRPVRGTGRRRRVATSVLVATAAVTLVLALLVGYVQRAAINSGQFANRATAALRDDSVRTLIAQRVTDDLVLPRAGDLLAARPLIQTVVSSVVGGRAFTTAFRAGVRDVHAAVFNRDEHTVTLALADVGTIVAAGLEVVQPSLARKVETTRRVELVRRDIGSASADAVRLAKTIRLLAAVLALVALASAVGAIWLSTDRRRTVTHLGVGAAIGGLVLIVAWRVGRVVVLDRVTGADTRDAVGAIWDAFLGDLRTAAWILAASGAIVAAAAASLIRPVDLQAPLRRAGRWTVTEPSRPAARVLRAGVLVGAGLACLLARDAILVLLFTAAGLYLIYAGVSAVLWLVYAPRPERAARRRHDPPSRPARRRLAAPLLAAVLIGGAVALFLGAGGVTTAAPVAGPCNGHRALCGRTLPQVALPATHNSMAVPLPGWYASEQDHPIAEQLRDGIRGLLIDTHYADRLGNGRLRTVVGDAHKLRRQAKQDGLSPSAVDAALRIRERVGFSGGGERGMYLCHTFCELGGTPLAESLRDLHDFLVANPGEVVVVVNQDEVTPKDFVGAVEDAGLGGMAYQGPVSGRWWTLRRMIDRNQRVLFLAENHAGAAPWYHLAYRAITQETPYTFPTPAKLTDPSKVARTCRRNRGPARAPLFLVNHWISTDPVPRPSDAEAVNAYEPLMRRLRTCERIRHHIPNLVAVNFYRRGNVMRAIDTLNRVR